MRFKPVAPTVQPPDSPLLLFDELPRMTGAVPELWRQQGDILREYRRAFANAADVAVELPTGTGKTIVGLLIAEWRRRRGEQVVYACPTRQLAHQVTAVANTEGIPVVTLAGRWRSWPPVDRSRYESADAVAITTYNTVFNVSPKIGIPGTLLRTSPRRSMRFSRKVSSGGLRLNRSSSLHDERPYDGIRTVLSAWRHRRRSR